jgi:hypothetical protein
MVITCLRDKVINLEGYKAEYCTFCDGVLAYPFVYYSPKVFICRECCRDDRKGLMADMVQVAAITEMNNLITGNCTLIRVCTADADRVTTLLVVKGAS